MSGWKVHVSRVCLPAVFRLQGLVTLMTGYSLRVPGRFFFAPAALLGFALRSFLLQKGIPPVSERKDPPTVSPACIPFAEASGRLAGRSSWVWPFLKSLATYVCLAHRPLAAPLGFLPSRALHENLGRDFAQPPLTRFPPAEAGSGASESQSVFVPALSSAHINANGLDEAALRGFLHQSPPMHSGGVYPGL